MKNRSLALFALVSLIATAGSAFADFVPGRVRPGMRAEMKTVQATGIFASVRSAVATINFEDGKAMPVSLSVSLDGVRRPPYTLQIQSVEKTGCGDVYTASTGPSRSPTTIVLKDYTNAMCERVITNIWEVELTNIGGRNDAEGSSLELAGNPEPVFVTL